MALIVTDKDKLNAAMEATADAIRAKTGGDALIPWDYANDRGFADAIAAIPAGTPPVLQPATFTENGIYTPPTGVDGFSQVIVGVTVRSPRCDQVVTFDWGEYQKHMAWMDGTPEPWPDPPDPPAPLPGPSVSFTSGPDADVAAAIDAASAGTINLQNGANAWHVGDVRTIHLDAWTGGKDLDLDPVSHPAEDVKIVISSFANYMNCGNVLQFDFAECVTGRVIMNTQNVTSGGYGATDVYTNALPAMVEALPSWIKTRLKTFSVLATAGNGSSYVATVTGNKLALRSEAEIFGATTWAKASEGTIVPYYELAENRIKLTAGTENADSWWERSPGPDFAFCRVLSNGDPRYYGARSDVALAPFGCLGGIEPADLPGPSVSFTSGSDADVAAAIDAANAGTINLQNGANAWHVGDKRTIHLDAWTGGDSVAHAAEDLQIVISQFGDYNNCGCKMQFDFVDCCTGGQHMNATTTTAGGYGATEMYTTTLPALVNALPSWLKTRLKTFSVLASAGGSSLSTIETVTGNKLALRAEAEIFASPQGQAGEGSQIDYYKISGTRVKTLGSGGSATGWWERSAITGSQFGLVTTIGGFTTGYADDLLGVAPFGCL